MGKYRLRFRRSVAKDLRAIPKKDRQRIVRAIRSLAEDPRPAGCQKLSGRDKYRVRSGQYRIIYAVQDVILVVTATQSGRRRAPLASPTN